ncbi:unnamed protein product [Mytilus edulis]|uniref:ZMYM2-like/QRICH1 C-terminal domain-containing protein n=1 Tax=Mytilus edulis TaxID=6550 RepID=A0A8S3UZI0_MYTED|nr:unnamed protein product [Mytilus edulis]
MHDNEIANFYLQTRPSINYYTFQQTSPQMAQNNEQPHPSQTIIPGPSNLNLVQTANISDIDFLDDDFELEVQSQDSQLNKILQEIDDDLKDERTTYANPLNSMNPLTNIQSDQNLNEQNLADIPTMMYSVNTFKQFLNDIKSETREIYTIEPTELDTYLQEFFIGIRKQTKNENEEKEYQPGNLPNAAEAIESDEEEELFSSGAFGTSNPDSLLAAIWYLNTIHFGLRGSHEHRQLKWGDVTMGTEPNGNKKLTYMRD